LKVLSINTYGGSLLLAARLARLDVVASLEDVGFGSDLQALNFPRIPRYESREAWPDTFPGAAWRDIVAIAHPPCAAFSMQNRDSKNAHAQGTDAESFQCHINVMNYALGHGCAALAIESVPGALVARDIYEKYATKYGYKMYFITQNAVSFGVPQWRERVWMWFSKRATLTVDFRPAYKLLRNVVRHDGEPVTLPDKIQKVTDAGLRKLDVAADELRGKFFSITRKAGIHNSEDTWNKFTATNGNGTRIWRSEFPFFADPEDFSLVIMSNSSFYMYGKPLTDKDMCRIMGFPVNYKWGRRSKQYRTYLSKGICPPVGAWVLKQLVANTEHTARGQYLIRPGELLDLRPKRADALKEARTTCKG
jgi:site-specific DNA-cytosine methylase